jgi:hypothetical protein
MGGNSMTRVFHVGLLAVTLAVAGLVSADAQTNTSLGSVTLKQGVKANGQPLGAGTYQVRLTADEAQPAVGQSAGAERWVEFVRGGKVVGKEVVSIVSDADIAQVADGPGKPAKGGTRVDTLKGGDYVRVWINRAGNNYLIHLPV